MRGAWKGLVPAVLALAIVGCAPAEEDPVVRLRVTDDPTVTFKVWFKVGSQDDPVGKEGLAYLTAQMISDASTTENSLEAIQEKLYPLAAAYTISVDREMTVLSGRVHRDNLQPFFTLLTDAYLRPAFTEADFARIKGDTLNYLRNSLRYQADEELGKAALYGYVFAGTPYAHPPEGTVKGVESATLDDVKEFYRRHYTQDNVVFAVGGGFEDAGVERLAATRAELPPGPAADKVTVEPAPIDSVQVLLVSKPDADASISFGFPIDVLRGDREFYALWIANSWLGEHRNSSSHLYQVIREARGMNYGDYSYIEAFTSGGRRQTPPPHVGRHHQIFEVWIRTLPNEQAHFALRAALRELRDLVDGGMTPEEFELTRSFLKKYVLHFADTTRARLAYAVDDRFYGIGNEGHLARFRKMMDEITLDEVNAALKKHLSSENMKIAVVTGDAEGLKSALLEDAASPITYASPKPPEILAEDEVIATFPLHVAGVQVVPVDRMFEE